MNLSTFLALLRLPFVLIAVVIAFYTVGIGALIVTSWRSLRREWGTA